MLHTAPPSRAGLARLRPRAGLGLGRHDLALVGIAMIWGTTFLIIHIAMRHCGPLFFVGLRFAAAGLFTLLAFPRALSGLTRRELAAGTLIGVSLLLGYSLQTYGLESVTSSTSAFITALYVPLVPLFQWALTRRAPKAAAWVGVGCAFAGLVLLSGPQAGGVRLGRGELATLGAAIAVAAEIVLIGRFAGRVDLRRITVVQLITCAVLSFAAMPVTGEALPAFSWVWLAAGVGLGAASGLIQLTMNWAQKHVPATRATVIYAGEPVWAGVIGAIAGDPLPAPTFAGAALIVLGVLVSELQPRSRRGSRAPDHSRAPDRSAAAVVDPGVAGGVIAGAAAPSAPDPSLDCAVYQD
jgi:drug/metabolite transporter (DMT)-like permease